MLKEEFGNNVSLASRELGIDRKRIREWRDKEGTYLETPDKKRKRAIGSGRTPKFPHIEQQLFTWFQSQREKRLSVNYFRVREEANRIREEMGIEKEEFLCSNSY